LKTSPFQKTILIKSKALHDQYARLQTVNDFIAKGAF
jgi:hypothetical protein